ncbi:MAG: purine-cytosine permease family protein [Clostridia bacterium]
MQEPVSDAAWRIETNGANPVDGRERHGSLRDLFWVWFAANLAIVGMVLGAATMSYGLAFWQAILAILGAFSFVLIGYFAVPGARTGVPTMVLSRASFGTRGNLLPSLVSWLNLVGWETVVLVVATYALEGVFRRLFGLPPSAATLSLSLVAVMVVAFSVALLGHATLVRVQTLFSYIFGLLTVAVAVWLVPYINLTRTFSAPPGPWLTGFLPALSIVVAGTGLSWVNTAADYTRYLPSSTPSRGIIASTTWGAVIPAMALMLLGALLYSGMPQLATSGNYIGLLEGALPAWLAVPYLLTAVASMVTGDIMDIYSSGLSLLAARVRVARYKTVIVDAVLSGAASLYVILAAHNFIATFSAFLTLLAAVLAPWAGVFLVDLTTRLKRGIAVDALYAEENSAYGAIRWPALASWMAGLALGLSLTSSALWSGPLAHGIFQGSNLGYLAGFALASGLYAVLGRGR